MSIKPVTPVTPTPQPNNDKPPGQDTNSTPSTKKEESSTALTPPSGQEGSIEITKDGQGNYTGVKGSI